jgi:serine/threonine protein kinase
LEQDFLCIQAIFYFADYHIKNFYHGDIKPDNIFIYEDTLHVTSDAGTLLYLGDDSAIDNPRYVIT